MPVLEFEVKTVTRGIYYKFAILNSPKINTLGENCHQFLLAYQNLTKLVDLEREDPRLQQVGFLDLEGPKFHIYIKWKARQQNSLQIKVFKGAFFFNFAYLLTIKFIWGNSKSGKRGNKKNII